MFIISVKQKNQWKAADSLPTSDLVRVRLQKDMVFYSLPNGYYWAVDITNLRTTWIGLFHRNTEDVILSAPLKRGSVRELRKVQYRMIGWFDRSRDSFDRYVGVDAD